MRGDAKILGVNSRPTALVVTGAGGRLGRLLRAAWRAAPPLALRPLYAGRQDGADIQWDILAGPLPDWPAGAVVLHLAGVTRGPEAALADNPRLVAPLVAACRRNAACALLFASTAAVYAPSATPAGEEVPPAPAGAYGRAKAAAEAELRALGPEFPACVLRLGNVAGADALLGPRPAGGRILLDPVPGRDGGPLRSWIGPATLARVLAELAGRAAAGKALPAVLNLAAAPPLTMGALLAASGRDWAYGPPAPGVVPAAVMDTARLQALCPLPSASPEALLAEVAALEALLP